MSDVHKIIRACHIIEVRERLTKSQERIKSETVSINFLANPEIVDAMEQCEDCKTDLDRYDRKYVVPCRVHHYHIWLDVWDGYAVRVINNEAVTIKKYGTTRKAPKPKSYERTPGRPLNAKGRPN